MDAVARFRSASETNNIPELVQTLAPDAELVSPLSGRMVFRGRSDLEVLLGAVYGSLKDLRWGQEVGDGELRVVIGEGRVGPLALGDAMALELDSEGRIKRIRPHLRPWLSLTVFALMIGPKLVRNPGVIWRALRGS
jgi:hypothetical protein